jgi:hypothetical protein
LKDFYDHLLSADKFYVAGRTAIGTDARLTLPTMVKDSLEITEFGFNIEECLF